MKVSCVNLSYRNSELRYFVSGMDILPIRVVGIDFSEIIVNATLLGCMSVYFTALFELRGQIFVGLALFPSQDCSNGVSQSRDNLHVFVSGKQ